MMSFVLPGETPAYHYGTHYSSAMIVASYLVRMEPFTQIFLRLQVCFLLSFPSSAVKFSILKTLLKFVLGQIYFRWRRLNTKHGQMLHKLVCIHGSNLLMLLKLLNLCQVPFKLFVCMITREDILTWLTGCFTVCVKPGTPPPSTTWPT